MRTVFTVPATLTLLAIGISAANAAEEEVYEMITTAIHVRSSETALPVTVLANDALHNAVKATLGDTLSSQPGINNASFGPAVGQTVIRGQQGRRVMNLTNGLPNADASGNSADHAMTVEAVLANAIEVLRGPSTLLYGGGAIGGVVNVIDRRIATTLPDAPAFAFESRHDSAADLQTHVGSVDVPTGSFVWHADALRREWNEQEIPGLAIDPRYLEETHDEEHEEQHEGEEHHEEAENTDGFIPNSGGKTESWTLGSSWVNSAGYIGLAFSRLDNNYGLPAGAHSHDHEEDHNEEDHEALEAEEENVSIDMQRDRYDLQTEWRDLQPWLENLNYKLSYTDYAHAEMEGPGIVGTRFSNKSWQQRLQLTHSEFAGFHGVLGLQDSQEEFGAVGLESFIPVTDIDSKGIFLVEDYHFPSVTIELGARLNHDDYAPQQHAAPDRDFSTSSLSASALWDVNEPLTFGLSLAGSERAPSIEELYSNFGLSDPEACVIHFATGACEIGSINFKEEKSVNTDFTMYLDYDRFNATLTLFYNDFSDYIGQITTGEEAGGFPVRAYEQIDARFTGVEIDTSYQLNELVSLRLFGDTMRGKFDKAGDVPRMPPSRVGFEVNLAADDWTAYLSLLHAADQDKPGNFEIATDGYDRVDAGIDYTIDSSNGELLLFLKGRNLGDQEIRLASSYLRGFAPEAGRSIEAGMRYRY
ncbi:MAG: TonB-dependent receptor [Pseudomonadota bacterium]